MPSRCDNCALRLYNKKSHNLHGVGNPFSGNCIVIPNVDYEAYKGKSIEFSAQIKIIKNILLPSTGGEDSNLYIVPLIRCNERISCEVDNQTYTNCLGYFAHDVLHYDLRNIMLLGSAAKRFLNCNIHDYIDTMCVSNNHRRYFVNYAPFIKYNNEVLFNSFKEHLIKWYNSCCNDVFDYKIRKI